MNYFIDFPVMDHIQLMRESGIAAFAEANRRRTC